ncbi:Ubiquitin carboxyl-terminal hydrolase [Quillaja saponaria]|uniref:Ubiquitin carboxyl-terminal hydrolase n=1 Tax=Quillaja saponaria TaxID=32244 RepID=A0AAD7VG42_QUISA|nr:Ubiquitin carboxyl-terminal hydrolase [Quillaja saponaria]
MQQLDTTPVERNSKRPKIIVKTPRLLEDKDSDLSNPNNPDAGSDGIVRSVREPRPAHYILKIQSYSLLAECGLEKYESGVFEVGGYKWRLTFYPNGKKKSNGNSGHISLYLTMAEVDKLPVGWEVYVSFKLFLQDQLRDKYLTFQDTYEDVRRFTAMRTEWGFQGFLSLDTFKDAANGYLVDDCCVFGAEILVVQFTGRWECLTMVKEPVNSTFRWEIKNFSTMDREFYWSELFTLGESKWKLSIYPQGDSRVRGDQVNSNHLERTVKKWFDAGHNSIWGFSSFISLKDFKDASKGYIFNDTIIVEGQASIMSVTEDFQ